MNKTLFIIRKTKGLSPKKMAALIGMEEATYKELECAFAKVTPELATRLEDRFSVPGEYFMAFNKQANAQDYVDLLVREKQKLDNPKYDNIPAGTHIALATLTMEVLVMQQQLITTYDALIEAKMQQEALRELYESLKKSQAER